MWKIKKTEEEPMEEPMEEIKEKVKELPSVQKYKQSIATPKKERIQVVKELPVQTVREYQEKDGTIVHFITIEEALTEILNE